MIDLRRMGHIVALARLGNFGRAATAVGLTQSALSRSLQAAEAEYDLRLFDRGRGGATPTVAGRMVIAEFERLLRDVKAADENIRRVRSGTVGTVAIGLGPLVGSLSLPRVLPRIVNEFPGVKLDVVIGTASDLQQQILRDELDFGIFTGEPMSKSAEIEWTPLTRIPLALMARSGHPLSDRPVKREEVDGFPVIGAAVPENANPGAYDPHITCDNYEILLRLVRETDAIWMASPLGVADAMADGKLVVIECENYLQQDYGLVLARRSRRTAAPVAETVSKLFVSELVLIGKN